MKKKCITCMILDGDYVYILRHNKCKGLLIFPAGTVEEGENVFQTAIREMKEELGIDIKVVDMHLMLEMPIWYDRVDGIKIFDETVILVEKFSGTPKNLEPTKHLSLNRVLIEDIVKNPKEYAFTTWLACNRYLDSK